MDQVRSIALESFIQDISDSTEVLMQIFLAYWHNLGTGSGLKLSEQARAAGIQIGGNSRMSFCRGGSLYGELARFVLRLLGFKDKSKELALQPKGPPGNHGPPPGKFNCPAQTQSASVG